MIISSETISFSTTISLSISESSIELLIIESTKNIVSRINRNSFIHLSYNDFIDSPSEMIKGIFDFLELDYTESWINEISKDIKRKTPEIKTVADKNLYLIGGNILNQTINNNYTPF